MGSMGSFKLGGPKFDIDKFDGRMDYLLWECQMKVMLMAMGLGPILRPKPMDVSQDEWDGYYEQTVSLVNLHLKHVVFKLVGLETNVVCLFDNLKVKYHWQELSNILYTYLCI
jgi:hypothetical protein